MSKTYLFGFMFSIAVVVPYGAVPAPTNVISPVVSYAISRRRVSNPRVRNAREQLISR